MELFLARSSMWISLVFTGYPANVLLFYRTFRSYYVGNKHAVDICLVINVCMPCLSVVRCFIYLSGILVKVGLIVVVVAACGDVIFFSLHCICKALVACSACVM